MTREPPNWRTPRKEKYARECSVKKERQATGWRARRAFTPEFKDDVVQIANRWTIVQVARELTLTETALRELVRRTTHDCRTQCASGPQLDRETACLLPTVTRHRLQDDSSTVARQPHKRLELSEGSTTNSRLGGDEMTSPAVKKKLDPVLAAWSASRSLHGGGADFPRVRP